MSVLIDQDLLFPAEERSRAIARQLYAGVKNLPIISPHGHTDPRWYALNENFSDPAQLLIVPDHYVFRMLFSQGVRLEDLGVPTSDGSPVETDGRKIWRRFAENFFLFRGTPTRLWFDYVLSDVFGIAEPLIVNVPDSRIPQVAGRFLLEHVQSTNQPWGYRDDQTIHEPFPEKAADDARTAFDHHAGYAHRT
jgi:glucuronate isomerase